MGSLEQKQLAENNGFYKELFDNTKTVMLVIDPEKLSILNANPAALNFYGYSYNQITNLKIDEINCLSKDEIKESIDSIIKYGKGSFAFKHKLADCTIRDVEVFSTHIKNQNKGLIFSIIHDITNKNVVFKYLKEQREQFLIMLDTIPECIFVASKETHEIIFANEFLNNLAGRRVKGENCYEVFGYENANGDFCFNNVFKDKNTRAVSDFYNEKFGKYFYKIDRAIKWDKNHDAVFTLVIDITGLKTALLKLEKTKKELEKTIDTKDLFFSIISHDLRSPFNALLGFSELLLNEYDRFNKEDILESISSIYKTAEKTLSLLENLLSWAKTQSGEITFTPEKVDLKKLIQDVIDLVKPTADEKDISLSFECSGIQAYVDEEMIKTVLRNLLSNSIKFTQENGKIIISTHKNGDNYYTVSVEDNGQGMSREQADSLFNLDNRITNQIKNKGINTGLGLILSQEFIKWHSGEINVQSSPGKGSVFSITLPLNPHKPQ